MNNIELLKNIIEAEGNMKMFRYKEYVCLIVRTVFGNVNGYVGLPNTSRFYNENNYSNLPIECHGGITYINNALYWVDDSVFGKLRWIGFDTAHFNDKSFISTRGIDKRPYRSMKYVERELINVCEQIIKLEKEQEMIHA